MEEYIEIDSSMVREEGKVRICFVSLNNSNDLNLALSNFRDGKIVLVRIKELKKKNLEKLKKFVERIKRVVSVAEGELVSIDDEVLVLAPSQVKIVR